MAATVDEYEGLPPSAGPLTHMAAGALAGISEHVVMYPLDSLKTRMQVLSAPANAVQALRRALSADKARQLWRGVWSVILGAGPAHAVILAATIAADALMNPFDVVKQRLQIGAAGPGASGAPAVLRTFRRIYAAEGLSAFYVSYPTTLAISIPYNAVQFSVYEQVKQWLNPTDAYSPATHIISGGVAGAAAAALTTPLDVAKTVLQTRGASQDPQVRAVRGMADAIGLIWRRDGLRGFSRGLAPRVLTAIPSTAICWMSYEFFKVAIHTA
ncbi:mitochondrial carrier domain-containing protein [Schizophyllum amplum]|uniref:Mitochondrial carrier domain-containing protein n=1 Tax=Schizophyllum amplum TaxID=97359 RepID=A0A550C7C4_9AGAR|nr:mitochondrial carrier domain-containing protein [Auriculariopsis ampla]